jgi:hypothetical protein
MDEMSASVSELNRRRWLQLWKASGVILMTIFPEIVPKSRVSFSLKNSIPEMRQKCDCFQAFLSASSRYLGTRVAESDEEGRWKTEKEALPMLRHIM